MEDISCWQTKFVSCDYSDRLLKKLSQLNKEVSQPVDITEITKAIYYAKKYHGGQMRESGGPYYSHPIEVAYMLAENTALSITKYYRTDLLITALLHDVIEDTGLIKEKISNIFCDQIAQQVDDLTRVRVNRDITSAETVNSLFLQKKHELLLIKLFDRMHNLQTLSIKSPEKIKKIVRETLGTFLFLSEYLNLPSIAKELQSICIKNMQNSHDDQGQLTNFLFSFNDEEQILSLIYRNVLYPNHTL